MVFIDVSNVVQAMDALKKVLYLSYDGMTDPLGQSQVLPYLVGLAASKNIHVHIISFEKAERYEKSKKEIEVICKNNNLVWHPLSYTKKPPLLSTIYDIQRMKKLAYRLNKKAPFTIVHCRSYLAAIVGLKMKQKYRTKFLFDMRGFWADERVEGNIWELKNPIYKQTYNYFKKKESNFIQNADGIVSLTNNGKEIIKTWDSWKKNKNDIEVIPCCADLTLFDPETIDDFEKTTLLKHLSLKESQFVLGYIGSIGTWYLLPEMLDFFTVFLIKNPSAIFLFVTNENPAMISNLAKEKGIKTDNIRIVSSAREKMPLYISLFDFSIFFIKSSFSKQASSPVKQGELMAMGIPVLCNAGIGDTDDIIKKYNSGQVLHGTTLLDFSQIELEHTRFDTAKIRAGAKDFFDIEKGIEQYGELYERLWRK